MPDSLLHPASMPFPGFTIGANSLHPEAVRAVQARLNERGCGPVKVDGLYGPGTEAAVRLFQSRFFDLNHLPLSVDGRVGPVTWAALFGPASLPPMPKGSRLAQAALGAARAEVGVSEQPPGSNRGKKVEQFLASVGVPPGNPWCAAFVYWCVDKAAAEIAGSNCLPKTGGVLDMWSRAQKAGLPCLSADEAHAQPALVTSGMIFIMDFGQGHGHTGFVDSLSSGRLSTIEGNSNDGGSNEGTGVFGLTRRTLGSINAGFIALP